MMIDTKTFIRYLEKNRLTAASRIKPISIDYKMLTVLFSETIQDMPDDKWETVGIFNEANGEIHVIIVYSKGPGQVYPIIGGIFVGLDGTKSINEISIEKLSLKMASEIMEGLCREWLALVKPHLEFLYLMRQKQVSYVLNVAELGVYGVIGMMSLIENNIEGDEK